jgi:hypothetical protein
MDTSGEFRDQLSVGNPRRLRTVFTEVMIFPSNPDAGLAGGLMQQIRRKKIRFSCHVRVSNHFVVVTTTIEAEFSPH